MSATATSWRRSILEAGVWAAGVVSGGTAHPPAEPQSIFVLRNNDIGDLLVVTPMFEALRRRFPGARIVAGVGGWNVPVLQRNPHVTDVVAVNAPWHNQQVCRYRDMSVGGLLTAIRYILGSREARRLRQLRCDVGIDVLGSAQGSLLLLALGVRHRMGVKGYAGGHSAAHQHVVFDGSMHVGRSALRFAELLGASELPENRPQIFLSDAERAGGEERWASRDGSRRRVLLAPGGGYAAKRWPFDAFLELARRLARDATLDVAAAGGADDIELGRALAAEGVRNLAGELSLRETFAATAAADVVVCNSTMLMHAAAAFRKPAIVTLGPVYESASAHAALWGYPETVVLGREPGRRLTLAEPAEVEAELYRVLGRDV